MRRVITSLAPVRICDCGGWTDTWFGGPGVVLHVAITPGVRVEIRTAPAGSGDPPIRLALKNFQDAYGFDVVALPGRHPLIEAAVAAVPPPRAVALDIRLTSDMPPGASTGTSAAVVVALLAALERVHHRRLDIATLARAAHALETERVGLESGVQDQIAATYGGINFIEIDAYPHARVSPVDLPAHVGEILERRLLLVYLGRAHRSSSVHSAVIESLGRDGAGRSALERLRLAARDARTALVHGDLAAFGRALIANTHAQAALHADLVGRDVQRVIAAAAGEGASGWKVNGAGGDGGSLAVLLGPERDARARTVAAIAAALPAARDVPVSLAAAGVTVSDDPA